MQIKYPQSLIVYCDLFHIMSLFINSFTYFIFFHNFIDKVMNVQIFH